VGFRTVLKMTFCKKDNWKRAAEYLEGCQTIPNVEIRHRDLRVASWRSR
jgi:hypothetical protein